MKCHHGHNYSPGVRLSGTRRHRAGSFCFSRREEPDSAYWELRGLQPVEPLVPRGAGRLYRFLEGDAVQKVPGAGKTAASPICHHRFLLSTRSLAFLNKVGKNTPVFNTNANRGASRLLPQGLSVFNPQGVTPGMSPHPGANAGAGAAEGRGFVPRPGTALSAQQQQAKPFCPSFLFLSFNLTHHNLRLPGAPGCAAVALALLRQGFPSILQSRTVPALFFYSRLLILPLR